ncbi:MAG: alpha-glucosidase C-terminal domain-containing protein [Potamolinea sp.]
MIAFTRTYDGEHILVVANLSRFVQTVELDLSAFKGMIPVEIFGRTQFPAIGESSYFLSVSAYSFYWFTLKLQPSLTQLPRPQAQLPTLVVNGKWQNVLLQREVKSTLESILPDYLHSCRWFNGKTRTVQSAQITEVISVVYKDTEAKMIWLQVDYTQGNPETYLLLLGYAESEQANHLLAENSQAIIAHLQIQEKDSVGVLFEAIADKNFLTLPLEAIAQQSFL